MAKENITNKSEPSASIDELQKNIGYNFKNVKILIQALTHKSYTNERSGNKRDNNERLEFLGDAVLQCIISDILVERYPELTEGELSKFRAVLVSEDGLTVIAQKINLGEYLFMGRGEQLTGGKYKKSILSDALEALIASIYLDSKTNGGFEVIFSIIQNFFNEQITIAKNTFTSVDHKTKLQEIAQKLKLGIPKYQLIKETGPDHNKEFYSAVIINEKEMGQGQGKTKKLSEQQAAVMALSAIQIELDKNDC